MDMYRNAFPTMIALTMLVGCWTSGNPTAQDGPEMAQIRKDSCIAISRRLSADETLAGRSGNYQLTLVEVVNGNDSRSVRGTLTLRKQPEDSNRWAARQRPCMDSRTSISKRLAHTASAVSPVKTRRLPACSCSRETTPVSEAFF